jgi:sugar lactone lactonase YvrE
MTRFAATVLPALLFSTSAFAITVTTADPKTGPESITAAPDGGLILGSATPHIYRAAKGETQAKVFIDVSAVGSDVSFLGVLADGASNTLWACQAQPVPGTTNRHSSLRSFDLRTGAPKLSWALPGDSNTCNDISIGPDKAAYFSDTANSRIYRIRPGQTGAEMVIQNRALDGIDGLCFMGGVLYANNVSANTIWRIPLDASGKAGDPVNIWTDQPIRGPDGMRCTADRIFIAENRNGRASMLTINGDIAHVTVVKEGMTQPTAIDVGGDMLWVGDRAADGASSIPLPH